MKLNGFVITQQPSKTGVPDAGEMLPAEMGCGPGMNCWRRLRDWQAAGV